MKIFINILLLIFCFSCNNVDRPSETQTSQETKRNEATISNQALRKEEASPPPPPPPKRQTKEERKVIKEQEQSKIEKELTSRKDAMKYKLEEYNNAEKKWINVRSLNEDQFVRLKQQYDLVCDKQKLNPSIIFNQNYSNDYENSSMKTDKMDGKIFCLHNLMENENVFAKLFYGRNEGGHSTDAVYIFTMNNTSFQTQQLDLYIETAWDGYSIQIESDFIDQVTIKRNVTEVLGWREANDKDGTLQPYVETKQVFKLLEDGRLQKESEEIVKHNFERYLN